MCCEWLMCCAVVFDANASGYTSCTTERFATERRVLTAVSL